MYTVSFRNIRRNAGIRIIFIDWISGGGGDSGGGTWRESVYIGIISLTEDVARLTSRVSYLYITNKENTNDK
ncbi:MAG: hypothetical protein LBP19_06940 [Treponema sp.]|jgi:hypothetical protein|nr:hypothetical protein [Treponema sp.]